MIVLEFLTLVDIVSCLHETPFMPREDVVNRHYVHGATVIQIALVLIKLGVEFVFLIEFFLYLLGNLLNRNILHDFLAISFSDVNQHISWYDIRPLFLWDFPILYIKDGLRASPSYTEGLVL